jgi:hypothetical protein
LRRKVTASRRLEPSDHAGRHAAALGEWRSSSVPTPMVSSLCDPNFDVPFNPLPNGCLRYVCRRCGRNADVSKFRRVPCVKRPEHVSVEAFQVAVYGRSEKKETNEKQKENQRVHQQRKRATPEGKEYARSYYAKAKADPARWEVLNARAKLVRAKAAARPKLVKRPSAAARPCRGGRS